MKKKQWEPETMKGWWDGIASTAFPENLQRTLGEKCCNVSILREKDYQRLLKLARKTPKRTP